MLIRYWVRVDGLGGRGCCLQCFGMRFGERLGFESKAVQGSGFGA